VISSTTLYTCLLVTNLDSLADMCLSAHVGLLSQCDWQHGADLYIMLPRTIHGGSMPEELR
jgi:hypothetical protein